MVAQNFELQSSYLPVTLLFICIEGWDNLRVSSKNVANFFGDSECSICKSENVHIEQRFFLNCLYTLRHAEKLIGYKTRYIFLCNCVRAAFRFEEYLTSYAKYAQKRL
jgi:hypothetical protein